MAEYGKIYNKNMEEIPKVYIFQYFSYRVSGIDNIVAIIIFIIIADPTPRVAYIIEEFCS